MTYVSPIMLSTIEEAIAYSPEDISEKYWKVLQENANDCLISFINNCQNQLADKAWYLLRLINIRISYISCFNLLKTGEYYDAWCSLEQIEIGINSLLKNPFYHPDTFAVNSLKHLISQWQSLYPYKIFFSPGYLHKRKECSICNVEVSPWSDCEHKKGKVYAGVECIHIIKEVEFTEISLVLNPVQKYSVALYATDSEGSKTDIHEYTLLRFLVERIGLPYDRWSYVETTAFHPHDMFPNAQPEDACPCESGKSYKSCCLNEQGIKRPHYQFAFDFQPSDELPAVQFSGYGEKNGPAKITDLSS